MLVFIINVVDICKYFFIDNNDLRVLEIETIKILSLRNLIEYVVFIYDRLIG